MVASVILDVAIILGFPIGDAEVYTTHGTYIPLLGQFS